MIDIKFIEVAIGLVFIYLLLSLIATAINEFIMRFIYSRGENLKRAIKGMLDDKDKTEKLSEAFYDHPLLRKLTNPSSKNIKPSYLSGTTFSRILIEILGDSNLNNTDFTNIEKKLDEFFPKDSGSPTRKVIENFVKDANKNLEELKKSLEDWFDEMMERSAGWYKRKVQYVLLVLGFFLSAFFNADTIQIAKELANDPEARAGMVMLADQYIQQVEKTRAADSMAVRGDSQRLASGYFKTAHDSVLFKEFNRLISEDIPGAGSLVGMGWQFSPELNFWGRIKEILAAIPSRILGWLVTTFAISLGAPFWFDILKKIINIRHTGHKREIKRG